MGARGVEMRARGIKPVQTNIGMLSGSDLGLSFVFSNISIGGHIAGWWAGSSSASCSTSPTAVRTQALGTRAAWGSPPSPVAGALAVA